jgi:hypothetical protein
MLDDNELLNLELSCGKWTIEQQKDILEIIKSLNAEVDSAVDYYEE